MWKSTQKKRDISIGVSFILVYLESAENKPSKSITFYIKHGPYLKSGKEHGPLFIVPQPTL